MILSFFHDENSEGRSIKYPAMELVEFYSIFSKQIKQIKRSVFFCNRTNSPFSRVCKILQTS